MLTQLRLVVEFERKFYKNFYISDGNGICYYKDVNIAPWLIFKIFLYFLLYT